MRRSLQVKLSAVISLMVLVVVVGVCVALTRRFDDAMELQLQHKAVLYATLLSGELESAVAFDDRQTAREVFGSAALDEDLADIALYGSNGRLILGRGEVSSIAPARPASPTIRVLPHALEAIAPVVSKEGPQGVLVFQVTTTRVEAERRATLVAAILAALIALGGALAASWGIARSVSRRLARIATVADQVARGDFELPPLPPGPKDEIGRLTDGVNAMVERLRGFVRQIRDNAAHEQERLTQLVAERTGDLAFKNAELEASSEQYRLLVETTSAIPWEFSITRGAFTYIGPQVEAAFGYIRKNWTHAEWLAFVAPEDRQRLSEESRTTVGKGAFEMEYRLVAANGQIRHVRSTGNSVKGQTFIRGLLFDVTERRKLESELAQAQKLESIGRLASGVAHEINTPVQFVSDSIHFVQEAFTDLRPLFERYRAAREELAAKALAPELVTALEAAEEDADLGYLMENGPRALARAVEGLERVATLVRSMKEFAHPDQTEKSPADLNRAIATTLTIARSEYKYVAEVETSLGELPPVLCRISELNQAFLNIIVNAAHAIGDVVKGTEAKGRITVATREERGCAVVTIADTGGGIPEAIRSKVFDPFFTTKEVGKGTGQGLAIARSIVVDKHGGELTFDVAEGKGTTFTLRIPIGAPAALDAAA